MAQQQLPIEVVATATQRLAVLLSAGVTPPAAWGYVAEGATDAVGSAPSVSSPSLLAAAAQQLPAQRRQRREEARAAARASRVLQAAARAGEDGANVAEAIRAAVIGDLLVEAPIRAGARRRTSRASRAPAPSESARKVAEAWMALAAAWSVAHESGAPLAATLRQLAVSFRDQAQLERDLAVALSGPRSTARLVALMPAIGVAFGSLMGFDTINTLLLSVPGAVCLVLGGLLMVAGARWSSALVQRAGRGLGGEGQHADLTAIAMTGGASTERAQTLAMRAYERYTASVRHMPPPDVDEANAEAGAEAIAQPSGGSIAAAAELARDAAAIDDVLSLSRRAGIPAAELLRSEAQNARLNARSAGQQRAAQLAVSLMIPLGLCVLPAFMLLGVVPLLISVLSSTLTFI